MRGFFPSSTLSLHWRMTSFYYSSVVLFDHQYMLCRVSFSLEIRDDYLQRPNRTQQASNFLNSETSIFWQDYQDFFFFCLNLPFSCDKLRSLFPLYMSSDSLKPDYYVFIYKVYGYAFYSFYHIFFKIQSSL